MSDEEIGVYVKMLAAQWLHGSLPKCKKTIKKLINSRKVPSEMVLLKFALCDDGFLRNERLEKERAKQKSFAESRKDNANKRWNKDALASSSAMHVHDASICITDAFHLQSSSSTSVVEEKKETPVRGDVCTLDQALAFARANVMPPINAECATQWHDHMLSIGWQINNMPICDWRAALRGWASKWNTNTQFQKNEQKPSPHKGITESIPLKKL